MLPKELATNVAAMLEVSVGGEDVPPAQPSAARSMYNRRRRGAVGDAAPAKPRRVSLAELPVHGVIGGADDAAATAFAPGEASGVGEGGWSQGCDDHPTARGGEDPGGAAG